LGPIVLVVGTVVVVVGTRVVVGARVVVGVRVVASVVVSGKTARNGTPPPSIGTGAFVGRGQILMRATIRRSLFTPSSQISEYPEHPIPRPSKIPHQAENKQQASISRIDCDGLDEFLFVNAEHKKCNCTDFNDYDAYRPTVDRF